MIDPSVQCKPFVSYILSVVFVSFIPVPEIRAVSLLAFRDPRSFCAPKKYLLRRARKSRLVCSSEEKYEKSAFFFLHFSTTGHWTEESVTLGLETNRRSYAGRGTRIISLSRSTACYFWSSLPMICVRLKKQLREE